MGRLAISRGFPLSDASDEPVRLALVPPVDVATGEPATFAADALAAVHARLDVLERLTRLCEAGALSIDEFLIEKAKVLGHPRSALATPREAGAPPISFVPAESPAKPGTSLLGRLGWTVVPLGLLCGLGLTALSQPDAAGQIWQEALRLFGL